MLHFKYVGLLKINNFPENVCFLLRALDFYKVFYILGNMN